MPEENPTDEEIKKLFVETYGTERQLIELQAYMVGLYQPPEDFYDTLESAWQPNRVPLVVCRAVKAKWVTLTAGN